MTVSDLSPVSVGLDIFGTLFAFGFLVLLVAIVVMYFRDSHQSAHAVRRNYPVVGRFRYLFENLGEFFRQYFFAMDREELPFNRSQRNWIYRAAKDLDSTLAFGSTANLTQPGSIIFACHPFPALADDASEHDPEIIGPYCRYPYQARSLFNISAMSFGAISRPAVQALSAGAAKAGCWLNTGEGGLSPYHLEGNCDLVFQMGTAKYGVRDGIGELSDDKLAEVAAHSQVKMFEIKLSQGAKPGKGGILPAVKVTEEIARIRGIPAGEASISPNGHPDIRNVDQLIDMIIRVRRITGKPTGIKLVIGGTDVLRELCETIIARGSEDSAPDFITVDSGDGGTGAAPQSLMDYTGLLIRESLPWVVDTLQQYGLKNRVRVVASGKLINPVDVAWALCAGADYINSARGFMFALGCIQAMRCNKNTCPTGVTTHDPKLQNGLVPQEKAVRVAHYVKNMLYEVGTIAHSCGVSDPRHLTRRHARIMVEADLTRSLEEHYIRLNNAEHSVHNVRT